MAALKGFDSDSQNRHQGWDVDDYDDVPQPIRLGGGSGNGPRRRSPKRHSNGRSREPMALRYKIGIGLMIGGALLSRTNIPTAVINGAASNLNALGVGMHNGAIKSNTPDPIKSSIAFPTADGKTVSGVASYEIVPDKVEFVAPEGKKAGYFSVGINIVDIDKDKLAEIKPEYRDSIGRSQYFPLIHKYSDAAVVEACFKDLNKIGRAAIADPVLVPKTSGNYKPQELLKEAEVLYTISPFVPDVTDNPDKYNVIIGLAGSQNNNFVDPKVVC